MRSIYTLVFFLALSGQLYSQKVIVDVDRTGLSPEGLLKKVDQIKPQPVFTEKLLKTKFDSLSRIYSEIQRFSKNLPKHKISEEELINILNQKFFKDPSGAAGGTQHFPSSLPDHNLPDLGKAESLGPDFNSMASGPIKGLDLYMLELEIPGKQNVAPPLTRNLVNTEYLHFIDSIRSLNMKANRYKIKKIDVNRIESISVIKRKPTLKERSYFEALVGMYSGNFEGFQLSPAYGYTLSKNFSLGLGPSFQINPNSPNLVQNLGLRYFSKFEVLKRKAYFQIEDNMALGLKTSEVSQKGFLHNHKILAGAGYILPVLSPVSLNFNLLYNLNYNNREQWHSSPWVLRIGISTVKDIKR